jgi:hypothetical protein
MVSVVSGDGSTDMVQWGMGDAPPERKDGKTAWMVCMAEVDGEVRVEQGLDPSEEAGPKMRSAARRFTNHWIKPITSLVLPDWAGCTPMIQASAPLQKGASHGNT